MTAGSAGFEPVNRESTAGVIARQLRAAIMYGALPPGSQLGEVDLAARFRVSRGPLREAMQRLVQEGLLRAVLNRGIFVITLGPDDVRDIFVARSAVECAAASLLLQRDRKTVTDRLDQALDGIRDAARSGSQDALIDASLRFHEALVIASDNLRLVRMHGTLLVESRMCVTALDHRYLQPDEVVAEHARFVEAVRAGDGERLTKLVGAHMDDMLRRLAHTGQQPGSAA